MSQPALQASPQRTRSLLLILPRNATLCVSCKDSGDHKRLGKGRKECCTHIRAPFRHVLLNVPLCFILNDISRLNVLFAIIYQRNKIIQNFREITTMDEKRQFKILTLTFPLLGKKVPFWTCTLSEQRVSSPKAAFATKRVQMWSQ